MPTTFTHDCFGKDVFKNLSSRLKDTIRQGKDVYRIGLHGPDIFFYYKPRQKNEINQIGPAMHRENADLFFEKAIRVFHEKPSAPLASYLLGFACHFMLDSTCHGYIGAFERQTGCSHALIEEELDRYFMIREHKKPLSYLPASVLQPTRENCEIIGQVFPQVPVSELQFAVRWQRRFDWLLTCRNPIKEKIILGGMKVLGCYEELEGQVMRRQVNEACQESTAMLVDLYEKAVAETPDILENLYDCLYGEAALSERFSRNFE